MVTVLMSDMSEIEVPEELLQRSVHGLPRRVLHRQGSGCESRGTITGQTVDRGAGLTYFRIESLIKYLRNNRFDTYSRGQIQERLKELNQTVASGTKSSKALTARKNSSSLASRPSVPRSKPGHRQGEDIPF